MDSASVFYVFASVAGMQILSWAIPGPSHLAVALAAISGGRRAGLVAALGVALGAATLALLGVSGMAMVGKWLEPFSDMIRILGAAVLVGFGVSVLQNARRGWMLHLPKLSTARGGRTAFVTAYCAMICNPQAILIYGSVLTLFLPHQGSPAIKWLIVAQIGFLGAVLFGLAACLFSSPKVVTALERTGPFISYLAGWLVLLAGVVLAVSNMGG